MEEPKGVTRDDAAYSDPARITGELLQFIGIGFRALGFWGGRVSGFRVQGVASRNL